MISEKCITLKDKGSNPQEIVSSGEMFLYMRNGVLMSKNSNQEIRTYSNSSTSVKQGYNQTNSTTTLDTIWNMGIQCYNGFTYSFEMKLICSSSDVNSGVGLSLLVPSGIVNAIASAIVAADGTSARYDGLITSSGDSVVATSVPVASSMNLVTISGIFSCTSDGYMYPQFKSEVAGKTITIYTNSVAIYNVF